MVALPGDVARGGGRKRHPQPTAQGTVRSTTALLRASAAHRDLLLLPKRSRDGVAGGVRDAGLLRRPRAKDVAGTDGGGLRGGAACASHRTQPDVPGRPLLQRRGGGLRSRGRVAECPDYRRGDRPPGKGSLRVDVAPNLREPY